MAKRTKIGKFYVERNRLGQIKGWISMKRAYPVDRAKKGKTVKSGYGGKGDLAKVLARNVFRV